MDLAVDIRPAQAYRGPTRPRSDLMSACRKVEGTMLTNPNARRLLRKLLTLCLLVAALAVFSPARKTEARRFCGPDTNCRICPEFWECDYLTCDCVCVSEFCCRYYYPWDPDCGSR